MNEDRTPRQREFQDRLSALLGEFAYEVGPQFDGDVEAGVEMEMPVCLGWILVSQWTDVAGDHESSTVSMNSGSLAYPTRVGMLRIASRMAEGE